MDPILVTTVERGTADAPLLLIDHKGVIGTAIYETISKEITTVFVSSKQPTASATLIHIPYKHRIPEIPNSTYSMIVLVSNDEKDLWEIVKKCLKKAREDATPFIFIVDHAVIDEKMIEKMSS